MALKTSTSSFSQLSRCFATFLRGQEFAAATQTGDLDAPLWANLQGAVGTTAANIGKAFKDDLESFIKGKAMAKAAR